MINYIRHDEEFYFIAKLTSGEQIIGKGFATSEDSETLIYVEDPLEISLILKNLDNNKTVKGVGLNKWMQFSDEEFFIVREKDIITIAGLSEEFIAMYELFWNKERNIGDSDSDKKVELDSHMGHLGKVNDVRKKLEDLFKKS